MHFPSPDMMKQLLESEGIKVENNRVVDFKRLFWKPCEENNSEIF
jgi:methylated-DNA-protein-cysteine methyltransferase-like protein